MKQYTKDLGKVCVTTGGDYNSGESYEILTIVYDKNTNKSYLSKQNVPVGINIDNELYWQCIGSGKTSDDNFINLSYLDENNNLITYTLEEAIEKVNIEDRKVGAILSFYEVSDDVLFQPSWALYQFNSISVEDWYDSTKWKNIYYNRNKFVGWFDSLSELQTQRKYPEPGDYAYIGTNYQNSTIYKCYKKNAWENTKQSVQDFVQMIISGDLSILVNGNWGINGKDTGVSAIGVTKADTELNILQKRQKPTVYLKVDDIPENLSKKLTFVFGLPVPVDAKITAVTAIAESLAKRSQPTVNVTNSGEADDTRIAFEFGIPLPVDANISSVTANATQLEAGQKPTAKVTKSGEADDTRLEFTFGIPKGLKGDTGEISSVSAEVKKLAAGSDPTVSVENTGTTTESELKFNFGIPKGDKGDKGDTGAAAGIGNCTASVQMVEETVSPSCAVTTSGANTAKQFNFAFKIPYKNSSVIQVVPTPSDATVKINGVEKKSETVINGSQVTVNVSKSGYAEEEHIIRVNSDLIDRVNLIQTNPQKYSNLTYTISGDITSKDQTISSRESNFKITLRGIAHYYDGTSIQNVDVTDFIVFNCNNNNVTINPHGNINVKENNDKENNRSFSISYTYINSNNALITSTINFVQSKNKVASYKDLEIIPSSIQLDSLMEQPFDIQLYYKKVYEDNSEDRTNVPNNAIAQFNSNQSWVTCNKEELTILAEENTTGAARDAIIFVILTDDYNSLQTQKTITQKNTSTPRVEVDPTYKTFDNNEQTFTLNIDSNTNWRIS